MPDSKSPITEEWTTRIPAHSLQFPEFGELHAVLFAPNDDRGGGRHVVAINLPETPQHAVDLALRQATMLKTRVIICCATGEQAMQMADYATKGLQEHHRIALERGADGGWGAFNS